MSINPDIRDQAYQFFIEEAPELLQTLEMGVLTLSQERSTAKIHNLMRAAHTIKGGAASVGLDAIATLAHRLEAIFKALYSETFIIDTDLENQLLQACDCLRLPLAEQITTGYFDPEQALADADPILSQLEAHCGEALIQAESYMPSSAELGIDMVSSIFEVDVAEGLERLAAVVADPDAYEVVGEVRAQAEVFAGFAELLNLPRFGAIAETLQQALDLHPEAALEITELALLDFERSREAVLTGDRTGGVGASEALIALASGEVTDSINLTAGEATESDFFAPIDVDWTATASEAAAFDAEFEIAPGIEFNTVESDESEVESGIEPDLEPGSEELEAALESIGQLFDRSAPLQDLSIPTAQTDFADPIEQNSENTDTVFTAADQPEEAVGLVPFEQNLSEALQVSSAAELIPATPVSSKLNRSRQAQATPSLTVRVDAERLERMNNLVGELSINRDGLSLQNEQMQTALRTLLNRFAQFRTTVGNLQEVSDQMVVTPERYSPVSASSGYGLLGIKEATRPLYLPAASGSAPVEFDSLEMDSYGALNSQLQEILEDMMQLEEAVNDITLFSRQSNQLLDQQRPMLARLRDELMWARMLPLGEVLKHFPRVLRDLSTTYHKPVALKLTGTEVLVEKAILEKLYDPLLHLLRNAFDHGIEPPGVRYQQGKPEQGEIEIRALHKGNQTLIEIKDDGQGLNLDRIRSRALELGWLSFEQITVTPPAQLFELIFEPGFSTAYRVSELSGRGVGLDVVRSQLRSVKGTVAVTSIPGQGTTFTLSLPLTLTVAQLIICLVGSTALSVPADSIEEILTPQTGQTRQLGAQRFLQWREQVIPVYRLADLLSYACPLPETPPSQALATFSVPKNWAAPMLILRHEQQTFALEVDRLVTEQEMVIKPFSAAIAPPSYAYGCTILGDGSLVPVLDATALLASNLAQATTADAADPLTAFRHKSAHQVPPLVKSTQAPTVLVVDDAATLRRTLALFLQRAGFRVLQARDGWEAIDQLQQNTAVKLVICDIEMPNMNGFEFLSHRRQHAHLAEIPVAILTSRSNDKHRWLAMQLGANAYFTKPYLEHEFLAALKTMVGMTH